MDLGHFLTLQCVLRWSDSISLRADIQTADELDVFLRMKAVCKCLNLRLIMVFVLREGLQSYVCRELCGTSVLSESGGAATAHFY